MTTTADELPVHGSWARYGTHRCRCDLCRVGAATYRQRKRREAAKRGPVPAKAPPTPKPVLLALVSALGPLPRLPGAACAGRPRLWDERDTGAEPPETEAAARERHREALAICQRCPALTACRAWINELPTNERPVGVIAGRVNHRK